MTLFQILLHAVLTLGAIIAFTRLQGLRSFSKMSGFDFAVTVSFGSILASAVTSPGTPVWQPLAALAALFALQWAMSRGRVQSAGLRSMLDNAPRVVMRGSEIDEAALRHVGMTREDLAAKLREANVITLDEVHSVIVEATGDVSVLHGTAADEPDEFVMCGVRASRA